MSDNKETPKAIFKAVTPDGHTYQVFDDGTSEGFPDRTILFNHWLSLINFERGLRIPSANVSESEMTKTITVKGNFCDIVILDEDCIRVGITGKKINVDINGNYCSTSLFNSKEDGFSKIEMVLKYIQENKETLITTKPELFLFFSNIEKEQMSVFNEEF